MKKPRSQSHWLRALLVVGAFSWTSHAQIQTAGSLFVDLDATGLSPGVMSNVTNSGTLGGVFESRNSSGVAANGTIAMTNGIAAIQLSSSSCMQLLNDAGGALIPPPGGLVGTNATTTIEVWALNPGVADDECMVSWGRRGFAGQNMAFGYGYNGGFGAVTHGTSPDLGWDDIGGAPLNNIWHHLAYTYDGTVENVFVDGVLVNSKTGSLNIATNAGIMLGAQWTNNATAISTTPALASLFLARVRVHDGALDPAQVLNNFNAEKAAFIPPSINPQFLTTAPVHRYSFNEPDAADATGMEIHDSIGTAHGIVRGTNIQSVALFSGGRLVLPASESGTRPGPQMLAAYGDLPSGLLSANSLNKGGSGEMSIEVWYRNVGGVGNARVFEFGSCGTLGSPGSKIPDVGGRPTGDQGLDWFNYTSTLGANLNQRRLQWQNKDPLPAGTVTNSSAPAFDVTMMGTHQKDRHLVVTWKESTGQIIAYENGIRVGSIIVSNSMDSMNDLNVWLGRSVHTDPEFAGEFDEVRFYTNILSAGEVLGNFQTGAETINLNEQAASILRQPKSLTVQQSDSVSFYVLASGSPAVSYQWTKNGGAIPGATSNRYSISSANPSNSGDSYACIVSNFTGGVPNVVTSSVATLSVVPNQAPPMQILHDTRDGIRDNYAGTVGAIFQVGANPVPVTHLGFYDMNKDGLSRDHRVGIYDGLGVNLIASVTVPAGTSAYLTNGYRWVALTRPILLAPSTSYILSAEVFNNDGDGWPDQFVPGTWNPFFVGATLTSSRTARYGGAWPAAPVSNGGVNQAYGAPNLAVLPVGSPVLHLTSTNALRYTGDSAILVSSVVNGRAPLTVQWFKSPNILLTGQTNTTLTLSGFSLADSGDYYVVGNNAEGSGSSEMFHLTVLDRTPPIIKTEPTSRTVYIHQRTSFSVDAVGEQPLSYQWKFNGTDIPFATNSTLAIRDVTDARVGNYSVKITNNLGSTNSAVATLSVQKMPEGSFAAQVMDPSLLVYYRFSDVGDGGTALNLGNLGEANNGLYENAYPADGPLPPDFVNFDSTNMAVSFDGYESDVKIPGINLNVNAPVSVTFAAWIYKNGTQDPYAGIIFSRGADGANGFGVKRDPSGLSDMLEYHWNNANFGFNSGLIVPDNKWVFVALVVEPTRAMLYLHDDNGLIGATNNATHTAVAISDASTYVGWDSYAKNARRFYGAIDEPMIFDRALSGAELKTIYSAGKNEMPARLSMNVTTGRITLSWPKGVLQEADSVEGPYSNVADTSNPYTTTPGAAKKFYRVKVQ